MDSVDRGHRLQSKAILLCTLAAFSACNTLLESRPTIGLCGDGVLQSAVGEACDDGNNTPGDKCSATCQIEECGNGVPDPPEECDKGIRNDNNGDCTMLCKKARCGDGYHKTRGTLPYEICDDGNAINGDGCNPQCTMRGRVQVIAGTPGGMGIADGVGPAVRFAGIKDFIIDGDNLYLSDMRACTLRRLHIPTGVVATVAGQPRECRRIREGVGSKATLPSLHRMAKVGQALYAASADYIMKIDLSGSDYQVEALVQFNVGGSNRVKALAHNPMNSKVLYVASHTGVYSIVLPCSLEGLKIPKCQFTLIAGGSQGTNDGIGAQAKFLGITSLEVDAAGKVLYVGDTLTIRTLDLQTAEVKTVVGDYLARGHVDGDQKTASFDAIIDMVRSGDKLYVGEVTLGKQSQGGKGPRQRTGWSNLRLVDTKTWTVKTLAGTLGSPPPGKTPEVDGFGGFARMIEIQAIALWNDTVLLGAPASIRSYSLKTGQVATAAGSLVQEFTHYEVSAVASLNGLVYAPSYANYVLEIPTAQSRPRHRVSLCGSATKEMHFVDAMTMYGSELYLADYGIGGICRVDLEGKKGKPCCSSCKETCETVFQAKASPYGTYPDYYDKWNPTGLAYDGQYFYIAASKNSVVMKVDPKAQEIKELKMAWAWPGLYPWGIAYANKALYVTSPENNLILRIDPSSGAVRAVGSGSSRTMDGKGAKASFCHPVGIATDGTYLYVGESHCEPDPDTGTFHGHAIRQMNLQTEEVTTLVGPGPKPITVEGTGKQGSVNYPAALSYDAKTGALFVADPWDNVVLKVD